MLRDFRRLIALYITVGATSIPFGAAYAWLRLNTSVSPLALTVVMVLVTLPIVALAWRQTERYLERPRPIVICAGSTHAQVAVLFPTQVPAQAAVLVKTAVYAFATDRTVVERKHPPPYAAVSTVTAAVTIPA